MTGEGFDCAKSKAGADFRYKVYSPYWDYKTALQMHCKYMVVDDATVYTGSLNWSENSELRTFENLLRLREAELVKQYVERFEMKWKYGEGKLEGVIGEVREHDGKSPCHFSPMTRRRSINHLKPRSTATAVLRKVRPSLIGP